MFAKRSHLPLVVGTVATQPHSREPFTQTNGLWVMTVGNEPRPSLRSLHSPRSLLSLTHSPCGSALRALSPFAVSIHSCSVHSSLCVRVPVTATNHSVLGLFPPNTRSSFTYSFIPIHGSGSCSQPNREKREERIGTTMNSV
jgi:hypothetical protein